jgi:flagellar basal body-associated protein FliL
MMKKKKIILPVVLLLVVGVAYKMVLAPKPHAAVKKINGTLLALDPEFVINLAGGRYAKVSVSVLAKAVPKGEAGAAPELEQNGAVRAVITDDLTGVAAERLVSRSARKALLAVLVKDIKQQTDEEISRVFFTDIAVQ